MSDIEVEKENKAEEMEKEKTEGGEVEGATPAAASGSKGNEWEVVTLTASTYASTLPQQQAASDIPKEENAVEKEEEIALEKDENTEEEEEEEEEEKWVEAEGLLSEPDPDTDTAREEECAEREVKEWNEEMKGEEKGWWWKKKASSLYNCVKEGNPVWSIFVAAAAVVGFVLIWHHHHHQRKPVLHLTS